MSNEHDSDFAFDYDEQEPEETELECIEREICETHDYLYQIEEDIHKLWDNVMLDYLNNTSSKQILCHLSDHDYDKFHKLIYENSSVVKNMHQYLDNLYKRRKEIKSV